MCKLWHMSNYLQHSIQESEVLNQPEKCTLLSLLRAWVCSSQLLLGLASAVILGSKPHGTQTIFVSLAFKTPQNCRGQVPIFIFPRKRLAQLYFQPFHHVLQLAGLWRRHMSLTTCRAMAKTYEPYNLQGYGEDI
jgi:hypothetical protein